MDSRLSLEQCHSPLCYIGNNPECAQGNILGRGTSSIMCWMEGGKTRLKSVVLEDKFFDQNVQLTL